MVSTLVHLPIELLEETFTYLTRQDLQSLIFVCSVCADVGRLLLYQSINLSSDQPHIQHTLNLIGREPTVAVRISKAVLRTVPPQRDLPWIRPDFFLHSVNLRSLELRGFPFFHPEDQGIFNTTLQKHCPKLVSFTYRPGAVKFPDSGFELSGLKCITWQSSLGSSVALFLSYYSHFLTLSSDCRPQSDTDDDGLDRVAHTHLVQRHGRPQNRPTLRPLSGTSLSQPLVFRAWLVDTDQHPGTDEYRDHRIHPGTWLNRTSLFRKKKIQRHVFPVAREPP